VKYLTGSKLTGLITSVDRQTEGQRETHTDIDTYM